MPFEDILLNATITGATVAIGSYVMFRITLAQTKKALKHDIEQWLNSETGQKAIYSIGILLGNAIMQGTGIQKSGGKMKFQDLIMQGIAGFLQNRLFNNQQQPPPQG